MRDSIHVACPFCGERFEALVDASDGDSKYIEDCPVCCRPITLRLSVDGEGNADGLDASRDD